MKNQNANIPIKLDLPYSNTVLILGVLSLLLSAAGGFPGIISALIALKVRKKPEELYKYAPELYNKSSYGKIKAGVIMSYIGIVFSVLVLIVLLLFFPLVVAFF